MRAGSGFAARFVLTVSFPAKTKKSTVVFLFFPQGFASTGRDKPGFRPEFLPLTYLAKILSDIEEKGSVCVCVFYILPGFDAVQRPLED